MALNKFDIGKDIIWLEMDNLQSRTIMEPKFPEGYSLYTWQDGCEDVWFNIVKHSFGESFLEGRNIETFQDSYFSKSQFKKDGFFLVKHKDTYIATAFAWQDKEISTVGRLHWLAVLPQHRGKGIAKALCLCVIKFFQEQGKTSMVIKTEIYREKAIKLYERLGFTKVTV
ncbi:uncharacterized protein LOC110246823 [Exaiptasia diaphana]|uniref:N-acetyltransferase domain-containing protein n=1 Tax=Exaiptasia diaphana TaxID=2652724 RepID=A0A913XS63_EXADI|nr:uncharacterized protein LOC110246823 [Exaiptasia diaphana]KXJ24995.1 Mycothiol acetyltransferase [Exaiptasia diaphana]